MEDEIVMTIPCPRCGENGTVTLPTEQTERLVKGGVRLEVSCEEHGPIYRRIKRTIHPSKPWRYLTDGEETLGKGQAPQDAVNRAESTTKDLIS